jgi:hypothetical protein
MLSCKRKNDMKHRIGIPYHIIPIFIIFCCSCSSQDKRTHPISESLNNYYPTNIPWRNRGGGAFIDVLVNQQKASVLLDTGAAGFSLSAPSLAAKSILSSQAKHKNSYAFDVTGTEYPTKVFSEVAIDLHGIGMKGTVDISEERSDSRDGLIGNYFLKFTRALLAFPEKTLFVMGQQQNEETPSKLDDTLRQRGYHRAPLTHVRYSSVVRVQLYGSTYNFLIDTGCEWSVLDLKLAKNFGLVKNYRRPYTILSTIERSGNAYLCSPIPIGFSEGGYFTYHFFAVDLSGLNKSLKSIPVDLHVDGIIGFDFLAAHQCYLDCGNQVLYWKPTNQP